MTSKAVFTVLACASCAMAHLPIFSDGAAVTPDKAYKVTDITLSQVTYHEVTADTPRVWITFNGVAGQEVYMQLGVPRIDRLASYRPSMAIVGPDLPAATLPFDMPEGAGATLFPSDEVTEPRVFDEPFTGTTSWILREQTVTLPADGQYWLVAYEPSNTPGKLWMAFGKREQFTLSDIAELPEIVRTVRAFHEVPVGPGIPCFFPAAALMATFYFARHRVRRRAAR